MPLGILVVPSYVYEMGFFLRRMQTQRSADRLYSPRERLRRREEAYVLKPLYVDASRKSRSLSYKQVPVALLELVSRSFAVFDWHATVDVEDFLLASVEFPQVLEDVPADFYPVEQD